MSNSQFLFDYLPSFYKNFMIDSDGNNLLLPIFDIYYNAMGDAINQSQQIAMVPFIEQCDPIIIEFFSTIDVTFDNKFLTGYIIDSDIIKLEGLFLDANFTKPIIGSFTIKHNISNHIRYIEFANSLPLGQSDIFIQKVYRDKQILQNIWGNLIDYKKQIPDYNTLGDNFAIDYDLIKSDLDNYKNQLIALFYGVMNGPSIHTMYHGLGIFLGLKYAIFDGIITNYDGTTITLESLDGINISYITTGNIRSDLSVGSKLKKYELLEDPKYQFFDIFNNPAAFTQILLTGQAQNYLNLLNIDISNNEQYAHLTFDSTISFDDDNIYFDMGDGTGVGQDLTGTSSIYRYDPYTAINRFDSWVSPLFDNQKLYEMFKNLFIIRIDPIAYDQSQIKFYLDRIKPIWTKYLIEIIHAGS